MCSTTRWCRMVYSGRVHRTGAVSSGVEHSPYKRGVTGSNPVPPTCDNALVSILEEAAARHPQPLSVVTGREEGVRHVRAAHEHRADRRAIDRHGDHRAAVAGQAGDVLDRHPGGRHEAEGLQWAAPERCSRWSRRPSRCASSALTRRRPGVRRHDGAPSDLSCYDFLYVCKPPLARREQEPAASGSMRRSPARVRCALRPTAGQLARAELSHPWAARPPTAGVRPLPGRSRLGGRAPRQGRSIADVGIGAPPRTPGPPAPGSPQDHEEAVQTAPIEMSGGEALIFPPAIDPGKARQTGSCGSSPAAQAGRPAHVEGHRGQGHAKPGSTLRRRPAAPGAGRRQTGSQPRAVPYLVCWRGIIPACAGSTGRASRRLRPRRDHPRVRGEHHFPHDLTWLRPGSSPRARGALIFHPRTGVHTGIIPACAGSTWRAGAGR